MEAMIWKNKSQRIIRITGESGTDSRLEFIFANGAKLEQD